MSRKATDNTNFERLIAEARAAEEAGVFARTPVDVVDLLQRPTPSRLVRIYERAVVAVPMAACLGLVVGIASMLGGPGAVTPMATTNPSSGPCSPGVLAACLSGPNTAVTAECRCADFDADGDVDLLDLSTYQQQMASAY